MSRLSDQRKLNSSLRVARKKTKSSRLIQCPILNVGCGVKNSNHSTEASS